MTNIINIKDHNQDISDINTKISDVITDINRIDNSIGTEELPTTSKTLKGAIAETFQSVSSGKH